MTIFIAAPEQWTLENAFNILNLYHFELANDNIVITK